jgi:hypothetical protein
MKTTHDHTYLAELQLFTSDDMSFSASCHVPRVYSDHAIGPKELNMLNDSGFTAIDRSETFQREWEKYLSVPSVPQLFPEDGCFRLDALRFVWCLFPWRKSIVRLPAEPYFISLRTSRNIHKQTPPEIRELHRKKIGIIGLSVGHSVAIPLALERICGEIRLADFDHLELTNLNRIHSSVLNVGENKAINTARAIAEIDPFLPVKVYEQGVNEQNVIEFLTQDGRLDLVIEECDSGDIKLLTRMMCRKHQIPVLMETSDRGLLDVERFDLEPERPLLHGMLHEEAYKPGLSPEEKRQLLIDTFDLSQVSQRGLMSLTEIGKTINTWPQLATDVISGGATASMAARMILLGEPIISGRRYVDIQSIIRRDPEKFIAPKDRN